MGAAGTEKDRLLFETIEVKSVETEEGQEICSKPKAEGVSKERFEELNVGEMCRLKPPSAEVEED